MATVVLASSDVLEGYNKYCWRVEETNNDGEEVILKNNGDIWATTMFTNQ